MPTSIYIQSLARYLHTLTLRANTRPTILFLLARACFWDRVQRAHTERRDACVCLPVLTTRTYITEQTRAARAGETALTYQLCSSPQKSKMLEKWCKNGDFENDPLRYFSKFVCWSKATRRVGSCYFWLGFRPSSCSRFAFTAWPTMNASTRKPQPISKIQIGKSVGIGGLHAQNVEKSAKTVEKWLNYSVLCVFGVSLASGWLPKVRVRHTQVVRTKKRKSVSGIAHRKLYRVRIHVKRIYSGGMPHFWSKPGQIVGSNFLG